MELRNIFIVIILSHCSSSITYPNSPRTLGNFRVIFNEIKVFSEEMDRPEFAEFRAVTTGKRSRSKKVLDDNLPLRGHLLIQVKFGMPSHVIFHAELNDYYMKKGLQKTLPYWTIGSSTIPNVDLPFTSESVNYVIRNGDEKNVFPSSYSGLYGLFLLYFPQNNINEIRDLLVHQAVHGGLQRELTLVQIEKIKLRMQDYIVYGTKKNEGDDQDLINILSKFQIELIKINFNDFNRQAGASAFSYNRCVNDLNPMHNTLVIGLATPNGDNVCPNIQPTSSQLTESPSIAPTGLLSGSVTISPSVVPNILHNTALPDSPRVEHSDEIQRYKFRGSPIESQCKKIVLNAFHYFDNVDRHMCTAIKSSNDLTAVVVGLHRDTVYAIRRSEIKSTLLAPKKKRNRARPVMDQIDNFNENLLKDIVYSFYIKNLSPLLPNIRHEFIEKMEYQRQQKQLPIETDEPFTISLPTLSKKLKQMGFTFGKINNRAHVLFREDILSWRGRFLKRLKENKNLGTDAKDIVYLDETWIDPHERASKGWRISKPANNNERKSNSYRTAKCSKGPRLIVIHAGGSNGFIDGAAYVEKVSKKKTTVDYHDNVDGTMFRTWFKKLLLLLKKPTLIIADNAPYHSVSNIPKASDKKEVLYNWLVEKQKEDGSIIITPQLRKFELYDIIKKYKVKKNHYVMDNDARSLGHEVVRLPPYQCDLNPIELVWKDLKHEMRKKNTQQDVDIIKQAALDYMSSYTAAQWKAHVDHVDRLGDDYWEKDGHVEDKAVRNNIIIRLNGDSSESESDAELCDEESENYENSESSETEIFDSSDSSEDFSEVESSEDSELLTEEDEDVEEMDIT